MLNPSESPQPRSCADEGVEGSADAGLPTDVRQDQPWRDRSFPNSCTYACPVPHKPYLQNSTRPQSLRKGELCNGYAGGRASAHCQASGYGMRAWLCSQVLAHQHG